MNDYRQLSDHALLDLFQQGDSMAYEEIYHRYWALLFSHGRRILQDDEEAKDLVQDTFASSSSCKILLPWLKNFTG